MGGQSTGHSVSVPAANKEKGDKRETVEQRAQQSVDRLDKIVVLTSEQKPKVYALALTRAKAVDEIRLKYKGQGKKEEAKKEIKDVHKQYGTSTKALLTPEQINKLQEHHKANKESKKNGESENALPSTDKE